MWRTLIEDCQSWIGQAICLIESMQIAGWPSESGVVVFIDDCDGLTTAICSNGAVVLLLNP